MPIRMECKEENPDDCGRREFEFGERRAAIETASAATAILIPTSEKTKSQMKYVFHREVIYYNMNICIESIR